MKEAAGSIRVINPWNKEKDIAGSICPVTTMELKPSKKWETLAVVIDSCATVPVFNPMTAAAYPLMENEAFRLGHEYELESGDSIPCLGEKKIVVLTNEGTLRGYTSNVLMYPMASRCGA